RRSDEDGTDRPAGRDRRPFPAFRDRERPYPLPTAPEALASTSLERKGIERGEERTPDRTGRKTGDSERGKESGAGCQLTPSRTHRTCQIAASGQMEQPPHARGPQSFWGRPAQSAAGR